MDFSKGLVWPAMLVYEVLKFLNEELPATQRLASPQPAPTLYQAQAEVSIPSKKGAGFSAKAGEKCKIQTEEDCPKIGQVF